MKLFILILLFTGILIPGFGQRTELTGLVIDKQKQQPIEGATVVAMPTKQAVITDERGRFVFPVTKGIEEIRISAIGHETKIISINGIQTSVSIELATTSVQLSEVTISANPVDHYKSISKLDIKLRGINNSQEILRMVPGLFIGQHAGGGKAEQIFLRGFDIDHGTDISISVDGMPVNMVSHAHGQGYADLHFLIPELIDQVSFRKGTYYAEKGNFATSGFVDFKTFDEISSNTIKLETGLFNTYRGLAMVNLLGKKVESKQSAYLAAEYMHTNGYFDNPQDFDRLNLYGKYNVALNPNNKLAVSLSSFSSEWIASGQVPERAVQSGEIGFFGSIDPSEGGKTSRKNLNVQLVSSLSNGDLLKNQVFYTIYDFELYSNFTFFKDDPVNGDQIRQKESRNLFGASGSYRKINFAGMRRIISELGYTVRMDRTNDSELSRTTTKVVTREGLKLGNINETNLGIYLSETIQFNNEFSMNAGLRYDYFFSQYEDKLDNNRIGKAEAGILNPKLNFYYQPTSKTQFYFTTGRGFHSNDSRVVVPQGGLDILPPAYGADLGTVLKPHKNLLLNAALWYLWMEQEFVYVGDEGIVEPSGRSRRFGMDISARYQPAKWLYLDLDLNYSHGRAVEESKGSDYLPLAPAFTSIGGITFKSSMGLNASVRYRYLGNRPANNDNSLVAQGYFITDAFVNYIKKDFELGLSIQNLFDQRWKETQFDTESRLKDEAAPVSEIHFTPGTPFFAKLSFSYFF